MPNNIKIDYLTWVYDRSKISLEAFQRLTEQPTFEDDTGEVTGVALPPDRFHFKTIAGGIQLVSFFNGGELFGLKMARKYDFRVTRIDLALDIECESELAVRNRYELIKARLEDWQEQQDFTVATMDFKNRGNNKNGKAGFVMFTRAGEKQVRVYSKKEGVELGSPVRVEKRVRVELQLMKDLARQVYAKISPAYPLNKKVCFDAFQSVVYKIYGCDMFNLGKYDPNTLVLEKKVKPTTNFQSWVFDTIVPALVKHYFAFGVDLTPQISALVQERILAREAVNISPDTKQRNRIFEAARIRLEQEQAKLKAITDDAAQNQHLADIQSEGELPGG